jgi:hypothetical protein
MYVEVFTKDLCLSSAAFCSWLKEKLAANRRFVEDGVKAKAETDSYWHHAGLFVKQLDGIAKGT